MLSRTKSSASGNHTMDPSVELGPTCGASFARTWTTSTRMRTTPHSQRHSKVGKYLAHPRACERIQAKRQPRQPRPPKPQKQLPQQPCSRVASRHNIGIGQLPMLPLPLLPPSPKARTKARVKARAKVRMTKEKAKANLTYP